jgi:hypothetical protein
MEIKSHFSLAIMALAIFSATPVMADENPLEIYQQGNISYISGGIGDDEKAQLEATQSSYNLRIMNADKTGHFSGDTRIVISDLQHNILLDATSGPIFYANLPKGKYIIEGFSDGQSKKKTINISSSKAAHIRFIWPEEAASTDNY